MSKVTELTVTGGGFEHAVTRYEDMVVLTAWDVDGVLLPTEARKLAAALLTMADTAELAA